MRKFKRILSLLLSIFVIIPLITVAPMAQEVLFTSSAHESDDLTSEKAFDNDLTTRWASDAELVTDENYKWLQVSYPQPQTVNEITIHWQRDNVNSYEILISEDGNDWVSVHESLENTNLLEDIISLETAVVASHFRLVIKDFDSIGLDKDGNEVDYPSVSVYEMELNHVGEEQPAVKVEDPAVVVDQEPTPAVEEPTVNEPTVDPGLEVTATAYVGAQNENLALNKVVTGSDHEVNTQFTKEKIVDGTKGPSKPLATYYASNENDKPIHIIINLGQLTEVESAIIFWERAVADQNITAFTLSGSVDDNAYTPIYTQNTRVDVRNQYINFAATEIQYLKLDITEFDGGALDWVNVGIDEIEVYSHPTSEPVEAYVGAFGENLALGAEVTGTAHEPNTQYTKANMVDGDKNTRYSSDQNVKPVTFTFDLGQLSLLENVIIEWEREANTQNIIAFTLEGSVDGTAFDTLYTQTTKQQVKRQTIDLNAVEYRYLKLNITNYDAGTIGWANVGISEFEAYSTDAPEGVVSSLDQITTLAVNETYDAVVFPELVEGATLEIVGANMPQLVDLEGNVTRPLVNKTAYVTLKLTVAAASTQKEVTVNLVGKYDNPGINPAPIVIPDIQEWHGGEGFVSINSVNMSGDFPKAQRIYTADLESKGISGTNGTPIRFVQALDKGYHKEGYAITITPNEIVIEAETETGALYATRTLLHIGEESVPVGELRDYPRFAVRGFMLDTGRRFVPLHMVKKFMQTMVYYKLNDFQLHLNDNYIWLGDHGNDLEHVMNTAETGFRLESDIVGTNGVALTSEDHYTIEEFKELKDLAKELEMTLVPEFDTPGHALSFVKVRPELMYTGSVGGKHDAERVAMLDLTNPETLPFIKEVYEDMFEKHLFDLDIVHMGSDEFYGDVESYRKYVDDMLKYLRDEKGVTPRFWGSLSNKNGSTPVTSEGTQMNVWSRGWNTEQQALSEGYDIINILDMPNYIVPDGSMNRGVYTDFLNNQSVYNNWAPNNFKGNNGSIVDQSHPQMLGGAYALWNDIIDLRDTGMTSQDLFVRFFDSLPYVAERSWQSDRAPVNYATFTQRITDHSEHAHAPRTNPYYKSDIETITTEDLVNVDATVVSDGYDLTPTQTLTSPIAQLGNPAVAEFTFTLDTNDNNQVLASWGNNKIFARDDEGYVGYQFERYNIRFNGQIETGKEVTLRFVTSFQKTQVYLNDEPLNMVVNPRRPKIAHTTFVLPLETIGGFSGTLHSLNVTTGEFVDPTLVTPASYSASSEEIANASAVEGPIEFAFDNNLATYWHSQWSGGSFPITVDIALEEVTPLSRFSYQPRTNAHNGTVTGYELYTSVDGQNYELADSGTWEHNGNLKVIQLEGKEVKHLRFVITDAYADNGGSFGSAAEFYINRAVVTPDVPGDIAPLEALIATVEATDTTGMTQASIDALNAQLVLAQELVANPDVTQAQVDAMMIALQVALDGLTLENPPVVLTALEELIATVEATDTTGMSQASIDALNAQLVLAQELVANPDATQDEVDAMVIALQAALDGLVEEGTEVPIETEPYEIYPLVQNQLYYEGTTDLSSINLVLDENLDEFTKAKAIRIFEDHNITVNVVTEVVEGEVNVVVSTLESTIVTPRDQAHYSHIDAYELVSKENLITILGKDSDAAFHGLTSLDHILDQLTDNVIKHFVISDYADQLIRGYIEGFYGIPWTFEDRMSLMRFGGDFKMNAYIFAPKDDTYHKGANWANLYPEDQLQRMGELARVGNETKNRLVWTIHAFGTADGRNPALLNQNLASIIAKFEQLYSVGVRQFGVLADDVGSLDRGYITALLNGLNEWRKSKGDVYELVFCPVGYNHSWQGNYSELNDYEFGINGNPGLDSDILIFWTGQSVIGHVTQQTVNNFKTHNLPAGETERRDPLFWLNWPVIDYTWKRLLIGPGLMMNTGVEGLSGVVTNPMQEAEASKVALYSVADFTWNTDDFNPNQSWIDSFKYINPSAASAMLELAKHMSDPSPNGHGSNLPESVDLKPLLDAHIQLTKSGAAITESAQELITEFNIIIDAADTFLAETTNSKLVEEMRPFALSIKDLSLAIIGYLETQIALEANQTQSVWGLYSQATSLDQRSQTYKRPHITNGSMEIEPASKWIVPFKNALLDAITPEVNSIINPGIITTTFITSRTDSPTGSTDNAWDGNLLTETVYKSPSSSVAGDYVGLMYSKPITLNDVTFAMGNQANAMDTFASGKIQYTEDGVNWIDLNDTIYNRPTTRPNLAGATYKVEGLDLQVMGVRFIATVDTTNIWLGVRDIIVNEVIDEDALNPLVIKSSNFTVYSGSDGSIIDGNDDTFVWYDSGSDDQSHPGDYIGLNLQKPIQLGEVHVVVGGTSASDHFEEYVLEYSMDGVEYTVIDSYTQTAAKRTIDLDLTDQEITAQYIRVRNTKLRPNWIQFSEFSVKEAMAQSQRDLYTNLTSVNALTTQELDIATLQVAETTLNTNDYVGLKLERIKDLSRIELTEESSLTLQVSRNGVEWHTVTELNSVEDGRYIRLINLGTEPVTITNQTMSVYSKEIKSVTLVENTIGTLNGDLKNAFDGNRNTQVQFKGSQIEGRYFIYDLGQTIQLHDLKFVSRDSENDFPRHAKISVSSDGINFTYVLFLGNQDSVNPDEEDISYILPDHEISYKTKSVTGLDLETRYVKFEITRTKEGPDKWIRFAEIELNGNEYRRTENNPTIEVSDNVTPHQNRFNIVDENVLTTYTPDTSEAGSLIYHLSENTSGIQSVNLLQSPSKISNAAVSVYVQTVDGEFVWVNLGNMDNSMSRFSTAEFAHVLSIKVGWEANKAPTIFEIVLDRGEYVPLDPTTTYLVTFDSNGGSEIAASRVEEGVYVNQPSNPIRFGYEFTGWTLDGSPFDFYTPINSDLTLVANWKEVEVTYEVVETQDIPYRVSEVKSALFPVGYREVRTVGQVGTKTTTYTVVQKGDQEVSREVISSETTAYPITEVIIVGIGEYKSLELISAPTKLDYTKGETLDFTGLQVRATRHNNSTTLVDVTLDMITGVDFSGEAYGKQTATIHVDGLSTSFDVYYNRFIDITHTHWAYETINEAAALGIVKGYEDSTFRPNAQVTRAEAIVMLVRSLGVEIPVTTGSTFSDVADTHWAVNEIMFAVDQGIISSATTFRPNDKVTRGELAKMVTETYDLVIDTNNIKTFSDISSTHWAYDYIQALASNNVVSGFEDGTYGASKNATRAEFTKFIINALEVQQ